MKLWYRILKMFRPPVRVVRQAEVESIVFHDLKVLVGGTNPLLGDNRVSIRIKSNLVMTVGERVEVQLTDLGWFSHVAK